MQMVKSKSKVAIIGTGFVGASAAFTMALQQTANELVLIDVFKEKSIGEAMDINHGLPFMGQMSLYAGDYSDIKDCDVIVVTAGANRKPGETRLDLAKKNVLIAKELTQNIMKHYNHGVILVVSNPVDIITYMVQKWSGLPVGKVISSGTVLDSIRFRYLLSEKLNVDAKNVHGYIIGEHGDSQLPLWSGTHIAGKNINEYFNDPKSNLREEDKAIIAEGVKTAGATIIKNKGATYYGIAVAVNTIVETLLKNQNTIRTVGTVINGMYGIDDVVISLPSIVNSEGVQEVLQLNLTPEEEDALRFSANQVKSVLDEVKNL